VGLWNAGFAGAMPVDVGKARTWRRSTATATKPPCLADTEGNGAADFSILFTGNVTSTVTPDWRP